MTKDGVILLIGVLPPTNVTAENVEWTQLEGGQIQLDWTPKGDITNPYVGGWNVYKIQGISGTTVFPETASGVNENIWEELTFESHVATLPLSSQSWLDLTASKRVYALPTPSSPSTVKEIRTSKWPTSPESTALQVNSAATPFHHRLPWKISRTHGRSPTARIASSSNKIGRFATRLNCRGPGLPMRFKAT